MKRIVEIVALAFFTLAGLFAAAAEPITVTDILGREVTLEKPATRIILGQGRHIQALSLIHPDPVSIVAGWKDDMKRDMASYVEWQKKFPAIDDIPSVGAASDMSFSVEKAISLKPDLVVFGSIVRGKADNPLVKGALAGFESAGIPVVFVDFFTQPMENTLPSIEILGKLTGRAEQANAFIDLYRKKLDAIAARLSPDTKRPDVFMQVHASTLECCASPGNGVFNDFIVAAGGHNIAADVIPGVSGRVSLEYLIAADPDIYLATGGSHMIGKSGLVVGTGIEKQAAADSLKALLAAPGLSDLTAVAEHRAYGVWHLFNDSPTHIVMVEVLAKWFHPDLFADIEPQATLDELNANFLAVPLEGTYWIAPE